jgi:hypothetical protein
MAMIDVIKIKKDYRYPDYLVPFKTISNKRKIEQLKTIKNKKQMVLTQKNGRSI